MVIFLLVVINIYSLPLFITIIGNLAILLMCGSLFAPTGNTPNHKIVFSMIIVLTLYTLFVCMSADEISTYTIGKPLRMFVIYFMFSLMSRKLCRYSMVEITSGIVAGLLLHLICVYIQFFIPVSKMLFYIILDTNDKDSIIEFPLRAFGLCSSFDAAGLCLCVLMVLLWVIFKHCHNILYFILSVITLAGCFMVGRTAMLVSSVFFIFMLFSLFKVNKKYFIISTVIFYLIFYFAWGIAQNILDNDIIGNSYRDESVEYLTDDMLYFPQTLIGTVFGTGVSSDSSDIGYIKIIHMIGLVGTVMVLYMYLWTIGKLRPYKRQEISVYTFMVLFLMLLLLYNYKLLLLYASGINDLYFLLYFILTRRMTLKSIKN